MTTIHLAVDKMRLEEKLIAEAFKEWSNVVLVNIEDQLLRYDDPKVDAAVVRPVSMYRALYTAAVYEARSPFVVNPSEAIIYSGDKLLAYSRLASQGIPIPDTAYASTPKALDGIEPVKTLVVKPPVGSWGRLVARARTKLELEQTATLRTLLPCATQRNMIIQEHIETKGYDIRCIYIDGEVPGCIKRIKTNGEWRTNVALGSRVERTKVTSELEELTIKSAEAVKGFFVSVDILESSKGPLVNEVNGVPEFKGFLKATGINPAALLSIKLRRKLRK